MRKSLLVLSGIVGFVALICGVHGAPAADPVPPPRTAAEMTAIRAALAEVNPLYPAKAEPQPGDWIITHPEPGQTFEQYTTTNPNRPSRTRTTIYIQPLGRFANQTERKLLDETVDLLGRFYTVPVKTLEPLALEVIPEKARRKSPMTGKEQLLTSYILNDLLPPRRPADAVALLTLTTSDLWPGEGWNFVFGQASLTERVGVWSSARYGDPSESDESYRRCLLRMCKVAAHETGHMFGIEHCTAHECGMNGSNNLSETDRGPLGFCPECSAKIWWSCGAKPDKWYASLAEFAEKHEFKEDAAHWRKCQEALTK